MILTYRNAVFSDLPAIVQIYNSVVAGRMVTADTSEVSVADKTTWFNSHTNSRPLKVIFFESVLIGWISLTPFHHRPAYDGTAEVSIYLRTDQRRRGLGKQILEDCIAWCPSLHIHTLVALIFAHNLPSISLFEKCGFTEWGYLPDIAIMDNKSYSLKILGFKI